MCPESSHESQTKISWRQHTGQLSAFDRQEVFATRWSLRQALTGLVAFGLFFGFFHYVRPAIFESLVFLTRPSYLFLISYFPSALFLIVLFAIHKYFLFPDIRIIGTITRRNVLTGILAVSLVYVAVYSWGVALGQPQEHGMASLFALFGASQHNVIQHIVIMTASLMILPPIIEELAFRHFLLSVFPYKASFVIELAGIIFCAVLFTIVHFADYRHMSTFVQLFALGVVFGFARTRTDGLFLPIILHSYAIACALAGDWIIYS